MKNLNSLANSTYNNIIEDMHFVKNQGNNLEFRKGDTLQQFYKRENIQDEILERKKNSLKEKQKQMKEEFILYSGIAEEIQRLEHVVEQQ